MLFLSLTLTALSWSPAATVYPHGGFFPPPPPPPPWNGPGDTVPSGPSSPGPGGPSTPGGAGPSTPGPRAPGGGGPAAPGPSTPRQPIPSAPGGAPKSGPSTPGNGTQTSGFSFDSWHIWWNYNRDLYLDVKGAAWRKGPRTGRTNAERDQAARLEDRLRTEVVPALVAGWEDDTSTFLGLGCLAALAQIGQLSEFGEYADISTLFAAAVSNGNQKVAETAVASLGLSRRHDRIPTLASLLTDARDGRELARSSDVPTRLRAFAAYGLGLATRRTEIRDADRFVVLALEQAIAGDEGRTPDLGVACVTTLGLIESAPGVEGEVSVIDAKRIDLLLELLEDKKTHRLVRAHVPRALARVVQVANHPERERVAKGIVASLHARHREIRYGAIQALGMIGDADTETIDRKLRRELLELAKRGDLLDKNFARVALGEIAGRSGTSRGHAEKARAEIQTFLLRDLGGRKNQLRPWAAISLGVMAHGLRAEGTDLSPSVTNSLRLALHAARSPEEVGAIAIACGLARDHKASDILVAKLDKVSDATTKGNIALALGMVGARHALPKLRELQSESLYRPALLVEVSIGATLLGNEKVLDHLLDVLDQQNSSAAITAVARAMAFVGDERAIAPLLATVDNESLPERARSRAAAALGLIGDRDPVPWTLPIASHLNYSALPDSLHSPNGTGLLNIR